MQRVGGLHIGLIKAGEYALGVGGFKLGIKVDLLIGGVYKVMQALAGAGIRDLGGDFQRVIGYLEARQWNAVGGVIRIRGQRVSVEAYLVHFFGAQIYEGGANLSRGKAHLRGGQEVGIRILEV